MNIGIKIEEKWNKWNYILGATTLRMDLVTHSIRDGDSLNIYISGCSIPILLNGVYANKFEKDWDIWCKYYNSLNLNQRCYNASGVPPV